MNWSNNNNAVTYPNIIFNNDLILITPTRIPYCFSNYIEAVVVRVDESYIRGNQNLGTNFNIAQKSASTSNAYIVSDDNVAVRRPECGRQLAMDIPPMPHPAIPDVENQDISQFVK
jgi:hypothetical protein